MPPLLAAMANAGRHGVLVKSAVVMEQLGATTRVAFDKTGTLTEGTPRLTGITILPGAGLAERDVLALAAAAENPSGHPLGRAITAAAHEAGLAIAPADEFTSAPGCGVSALIRRARRVITANLIIAAVIITALVTWDLAGHLPLPLGVLGHEGSTVIVGLNGLRLLRTAAWRKANTSSAR